MAVTPDPFVIEWAAALWAQLHTHLLFVLALMGDQAMLHEAARYGLSDVLLDKMYGLPPGTVRAYIEAHGLVGAIRIDPSLTTGVFP